MVGAMAQLQSLGLFTGIAAGEDCDRHFDSSWKEFFRDPSQRWDNRSSKRSPGQPDFRHKFTKEPLWIDNRHSASWVPDELERRGFAAEQCIGAVSAAVPSLPSLIWACCKNKDLSGGTRIHFELNERGLAENRFSDALITMYAKCGDLQKAQALLDKHSSSSIVPWTALIASYAQHGQGQNALRCFDKMQSEGIPPNVVTYVCILKACAVIGAIEKGKQIHDEVLSQGLLVHSIVLGNALVNMYAKCGALPQAQSVLDKLPCRNVISWNGLITGYVQKEQGRRALECFEDMQCEGIIPDVVTYMCILKACALIGAIAKGKQIHEEVSSQGLLEQSLELGGALVDMYAKCGDLSQAHSVLERLPSRDVVSWSSLITGYVHAGQGQEAVKCFQQMQHEGISPDPMTYVCILKACAMIREIDKGKKIHDEISEQGLLKHNIVLGNALVDMYAKCGALPQARRVLEKLPSRDAISWSALIAGYVQEEQGQLALECLERMQREGIVPDTVTYLCILKACAVIGAIDKGKKIHDEILRQGLLEQSVELGGALVDMYAKCGALPKAQSVLLKLPSRNVVSWSALIGGYAQEGQGRQALECFEKMQHEGILPNIVTFISLLNVCSHLGWVEKGQELFDSMGTRYDLKPDVECFTCMVDLYGRAGHLVKAVEVIQEMPVPASSTIWLCLLGGCLKWVDVNVGTWAFAQAIELDKCDGAAYVLMANIYAEAGMPEKAKDIEFMRIKNKAWKQASWTKSNNGGLEFLVSDTQYSLEFNQAIGKAKRST